MQGLPTCRSLNRLRWTAFVFLARLHSMGLTLLLMYRLSTSTAIACTRHMLEGSAEGVALQVWTNSLLGPWPVGLLAASHAYLDLAHSPCTSQGLILYPSLLLFAPYLLVRLMILHVQQMEVMHYHPEGCTFIYGYVLKLLLHLST